MTPLTPSYLLDGIVETTQAGWRDSTSRRHIRRVSSCCYGGQRSRYRRRGMCDPLCPRLAGLLREPSFRRPPEGYLCRAKPYLLAPSTLSGSYSVWIYYHRFTKDTFYKVSRIHRPQDRVRGKASPAFGRRPLPSAGQRKEIGTGFLAELRAFRDEIAHIALLWNPDLNDGVVINYACGASVLITGHGRRTSRNAGRVRCRDYDWSHLALHLWPERVVPKCADDLSLAIAHGLENVFGRKMQRGNGRRAGSPQMTRRSCC
jgi:hypothetical protein